MPLYNYEDFKNEVCIKCGAAFTYRYGKAFDGCEWVIKKCINEKCNLSHRTTHHIHKHEKEIHEFFVTIPFVER